MADWHERKGVGLALRAAGLGLLLIAWLAGVLMTDLIKASGHHPLTVMQLLVAACTFGCASLGSALLVLGRHLFARVRVSDRWTPRPMPPIVRELEPEVLAMPTARR